MFRDDLRHRAAALICQSKRLFSLLSSQRVSRMETFDSRSTARGTMFVMKIIHFVWVHQFSRWNSFSFFFKFVLRCSPEFQILFLHYLDFSIFFLSLRAL